MPCTRINHSTYHPHRVLNHFKYYSFLLFFPMALVGCDSSMGKEKATPPTSKQGMPPAVPVTVTPAIHKTVYPFQEWTGRFESPETVDIRARVPGVIEHIYFKAGQIVHRGDALYKIDPAPFEAELARARAQALGARTQAQWAKAEAARSHKLLEAKAASQQEYDQLKAQERNTAAAVSAAEAAVKIAELNLSYTTIRSPIDGRISKTQATLGNLINAGTPVLTTVVSTNPMYVYFSMSENSYLKSVEMLQKEGNVKIAMGLANEEGTPHEGVLNFVDNRINPNTGTVQARAIFNNPDATWVPGLFARVHVPEGQPIEAILVPERAIGTDQSKKVVWVVGNDKKALPREVKPGWLEGDLRVITTGLQEGESVIVEGTQRVQPGMMVQAQPLAPEPHPTETTPPTPSTTSAPSSHKAAAPSPTTPSSH
jgi:RND family efflux transporter MFP subunit